MITKHHRAFSLLEVLIAVFILGIGLIMVASIFPVGANWTRQGVEQSVAQTVALDALSVIQSHYGPGSQDSFHNPGSANFPMSSITSSSVLVPLPGFVGTNGIPLAERCYQFGTTNPFPAADPSKAVYYWTALVRASSASGGVGFASSHDLYVFVFRKGNVTDTYTVSSGTAVTTEANNTIPLLVKDMYASGTYNAAYSPPVNGAIPRIGAFGVGESSGNIFRQTLSIDYTNMSNTTALAVPKYGSNDNNVIYALPANGTGESPLVYIYQTTVSY